jgi:basic membrane protein A
MRRLGMRLGLTAGALAMLFGIASADVSATQALTPKPRVAVVLDPGGCPTRDTLRLCEGIERAVRTTGVPVRVVTPTYRDDLADFLALLARQDYEAVVVFGLYYEPAVAAVARRYPNVPFYVMDAPRSHVPNAPSNVQGIVLQAREAAFLAGWLAAKLEARRPGPDVLGVIGGLKGVAGVTTFVDGFTVGAERAAPRAKVLVSYSNDFIDGAKCAALARRQIAQGAGTVFNVAGACGLGAMKAAADAGVWAVGVDTDQSFLGPHVLTSVLKSYEAGFTEVLMQVKEGRLRRGRDTTLTMRDGAAGLGKLSARVPPSLVAQLKALERRIVTGRLRVPPLVTSDVGG